jgi:hypothetical protein
LLGTYCIARRVARERSAAIGWAAAVPRSPR